MEPIAPQFCGRTPPDSDQSTAALTPDPQRSFGSLSINELVAYVIEQNARHHEQLTAALQAVAAERERADRAVAAERERADRAERARCCCAIA